MWVKGGEGRDTENVFKTDFLIGKSYLYQKTKQGTNFITMVDKKDEYDKPPSLVVVRLKPYHVIKSEESFVASYPN